MHMWQNVNSRGDKYELLLCEMILSIIALNLCSIFSDGKVLFLFKYVSFIFTPVLLRVREKFFYDNGLNAINFSFVHINHGSYRFWE